MEDLTNQNVTQGGADRAGLDGTALDGTGLDRTGLDGTGLDKASVALPLFGTAAVATPPVAPSDEAPEPLKKTPVQRRFSGFRILFGSATHLLGLCAVGTLSVLGGMAIAQLFPAPASEDPPWIETVLDQSGRSLGVLQRLPKTATQGLAHRLNPKPKPKLDAAAPILSEVQQQQVGTEIAALQNELAQMNARTSALEQQLGYQYPGETVELRLQALAQTVANPTAGPQSVANRDRARQPLLVTLPLDPLFEESQSLLKPASTVLLGAIVSELRSYPPSLVTIGAHADDVGAGPAKRDLSLRRAQAVAQYLQAQLGEAATPAPSDRSPNNRFLWNRVGYGDAEPLAPNDSNENRQRNRRLEIRVTPR